jgi:integrase
MYIKESKTKKHKIVELSDELYERLKYLWHPNRDYYAFTSRRSLYEPIHRVTYHRHLKIAATATQRACSAHSTRKLYAQNIFQRTKNIFDVQKALQHKYITTTAAYLDIDLVALIAGEADKKNKEQEDEKVMHVPSAGRDHNANQADGEAPGQE